ncbi:AraC family transcriptional regulator [Gracilibacillus suaedae]|uniref:AraC family transcriptional regulator n=1 Tax=Gracilibacillus suaedae TaxID=2820273 RepID=UPI001ABEDB1C|nr:AraC family transcriptional regulator [Gracilibacillus suaedae]
MNSLRQMNEAIAYIEAHLTTSINYKKVAQIAQCSEYHFKRMFSFLAGIPLSEYIRRRRMTLAALELKGEQTKIIDVALKYGYATPNSFAKAFHQVHGLMPSDMRDQAHSLKAYPQLTFQLTVRGVNEMNVRIVQKDDFSIIGTRKRMKVLENDVDPEINKLWEHASEDTLEELKKLSNLEPTGILHVLTNYSEEEIDYYFGVATSKNSSSSYDSLDIAEQTWAVFKVKGGWEDVQAAWERIYSEWFPSSNYEHSGAPEILSSKDEVSEIWIPIVKK